MTKTIAIRDVLTTDLESLIMSDLSVTGTKDMVDHLKVLVKDRDMFNKVLSDVVEIPTDNQYQFTYQGSKYNHTESNRQYVACQYYNKIVGKFIYNQLLENQYVCSLIEAQTRLETGIDYTKYDENDDFDLPDVHWTVHNANLVQLLLSVVSASQR